jgi:hypothetical protein
MRKLSMRDTEKAMLPVLFGIFLTPGRLRDCWLMC